MDGILNVLKPPGMTSFDVVAYLRGMLKIKKLGHAGTLDPCAVGVLPVCSGKATKVMQYIMAKNKFYRTELTLGVETDTQDGMGTRTAVKEVKADREEIIHVIKSFIGRYAQTPPMYSAIKIGGKKLYEIARAGKTVTIEPREVEVFSSDVLYIENNEKVLFDVSCSKGTYIRTLCSDIGERLGCGGHMSFLVRLSTGMFDIKNAYTLEEISCRFQNGKLGEILISIDDALAGFNRIVLAPSDEKKILNGAFVKLDDKKFKCGDLLRIYSMEERFIALGEVVLRDKCLFLKTKKLF